MATKDQSYFLYRLNQAQLSRTLFPIGHLYKRDVRKIARDYGLAEFFQERQHWNLFYRRAAFPGISQPLFAE